MKATSTTTIEWPKLKFVINAGEEKELPDDEEACAIILATPGVVEVQTKIKK